MEMGWTALGYKYILCIIVSIVISLNYFNSSHIFQDYPHGTWPVYHRYGPYYMYCIVLYCIVSVSLRCLT